MLGGGGITKKALRTIDCVVSQSALKPGGSLPAHFSLASRSVRLVRDVIESEVPATQALCSVLLTLILRLYSHCKLWNESTHNRNKIASVFWLFLKVIHIYIVFLQLNSLNIKLASITFFSWNIRWNARYINDWLEIWFETY